MGQQNTPVFKRKFKKQTYLFIQCILPNGEFIKNATLQSLVSSYDIFSLSCYPKQIRQLNKYNTLAINTQYESCYGQFPYMYILSPFFKANIFFFVFSVALANGNQTHIEEIMEFHQAPQSIIKVHNNSSLSHISKIQVSVLI